MVVVHNHLNESVEIEVRLTVDAEFTSILYEYDAEPFSVATRLHSTERADIEGDDLVFRLRVPARGTWKTRIQVAVRRGDQTLEPVGEARATPVRWG